MTKCAICNNQEANSRGYCKTCHHLFTVTTRTGGADYSVIREASLNRQNGLVVLHVQDFDDCKRRYNIPLTFEEFKVNHPDWKIKVKATNKYHLSNIKSVRGVYWGGL